MRAYFIAITSIDANNGSRDGQDEKERSRRCSGLVRQSTSTSGGLHRTPPDDAQSII